ncbi:hypothetical protein [Duganella hordei]|uniref:hypothetical protein n=1 Tax=Duganella hordei TaxID=2865934 RepID=UPI0030E81D8F
MNIAKNMEIIFVAATVLAAATSFATAADGPAAGLAVAPVAPAAKVAVSTAKMQVVTVTAKRLTAAEKAAL